MILVSAWTNSQGQQNTLKLSVANMNKSNLLYFVYGLGSVRRMIASQNGSINIPTYCWWMKSCTTWDVWDPINNGKKLPTSTGYVAGFLNHQRYDGMTLNMLVMWFCYSDLKSNIPLEHTPDSQPTVYEGIPFIWGFEDAWGMRLSGYIGIFLDSLIPETFQSIPFGLTSWSNDTSPCEGEWIVSQVGP